MSSIHVTTANVAYTRPEYTDLKPRWDLIRDCISGEDAIKEKTTDYLPKPNAEDTSAENDARYEAYVARAVFYNGTARTLNGLVGQVMTEPPAIELPTSIEFLENNIDGSKIQLAQQANMALARVVAYGRAALMVDYPTTNGETTKAQLEQNQIRPNIILVDAWDIINWRMVQVGGVSKLGLVVLSEAYTVNDDGYEEEYDDMWKVLRLDEEGLFVIEEWILDGDSKSLDGTAKEIKKPKYKLRVTVDGEVARYEPTDAAGKRLDYIPFCFIGSVNNNAAPDLPPLYDLAVLNIAHYHNSADYEEACFITGQPTPYFTGLTQDWVKEVFADGKVQLGSRAAVPLPEGASAGLLQATPNGMPFEAMQHKERLMASLGAKLVEQKTVQRTATEATMEGAAETSVLGTIANNVSAAYVTAVGYARRFVESVEDESNDDVVVKLNSNFRSATMTAQERTQLASEWMSGAITDEEMRAGLRRCGVAYMSDEDWADKRETQAMTKGLTSGAALPKDPDAKDETADDESL